MRSGGELRRGGLVGADGELVVELDAVGAEDGGGGGEGEGEGAEGLAD